MSDRKPKRPGSSEVRGETHPPASSPPAPGPARPGGETLSTAHVAPAAHVAPVAGPIRPLFRRTDWITFAITTFITLAGYWWTLAPDLTLEDSGELAVASLYAGVPHPPGYPVWTVYTWIFTWLFPVSNIAYRVAFSSAVAGALACGLVGLMVSRGSSMMIESIEFLKSVERKWENGLCMVAGVVGGLLIGFNGFMWSQAVIVEVYTLSVLSLAGVLVCLLRWIYAPSQRRYLYWAFFWFGISFNNHQSLLVTAIGLEVAVLAAAPRLGRDLFFWNTVCWIGGLLAKKLGLIGFFDSPNPNLINPLFVIFNLIGIASLGIWGMLAAKTKIKQEELFRDLTMVGALGYLLGLVAVITGYVTYFKFKTGAFIIFNVLGFSCIGGFGYYILHTTRLGREWLGALACGSTWLLGAACYVYMPIASMSNPPLNWGYPRTVQGFFHAFGRGQYERINPTNDVGRFIDQIFIYVGGAIDEFNIVYLLLGLTPFLFFRYMHKRERSWLIGLSAIYLCLSFFLLILLNPSPDRQSRDLNRVFFTASHVMIAMGAGYGLSLLGATLAIHYTRFRHIAIYACSGAAVLAVIAAAVIFSQSEFAIRNPILEVLPSMDPVTRLVAVLSILLSGAGLALFVMNKQVIPMTALLVLFSLLPLRSILAHWSDNEQRGHLFGFWFGHDMFTPPIEQEDGQPIYPPMARDAVLFGGTDPGRFNPTYMIFCESFIPPSKRRDPEFDRRDVYLITQNALADGTYLEYIRAHYNRSTQRDPYFFSELLRGNAERDANIKTNFIARIMLPVDRLFTGLGDRIEKRRRAGTSWFHEEDFTDLPALRAKLAPAPTRDPVSTFLYDRLSPATRERLDGGKDDGLAEALAEDFNAIMESEYQERQAMEKELDVLDRTLRDPAKKNAAIKERMAAYIAAQHQLFDAERFRHVELSPRTRRFLEQSPASHTLLRLDRILLEEAYPGLIATSQGGVYPDLEINTPSSEESNRAFQEYLADAQRRLARNELKPGENVQIIQNKVQVSGQVAVMAINALLTKVIFDANPHHEFYVEESFPLEWMYPHLSPFGIIMKINRNPLPQITQEMVDKDHRFWSKYSERLIGNWITYDTTVEEVCEFVQRVHIRRNLAEYDAKYDGSMKFMRDNDGQKAFSKLRSSIGGVYNWRITHATTPEEQQRMIQEAEFAFKQAFAFCPYSPEALFRYAQLLSTLGRFDEAILLARTSYELDPYNQQIAGLIGELRRYQSQMGGMPALPPPTAPPAPVDPAQAQAQLARLEGILDTNPVDLPTMVQYVQACEEQNQRARAITALDKMILSSNASATMVLFAAQKFNEMALIAKVEEALRRLVEFLPSNPEAWYDLAGVQASQSKAEPALTSLATSLGLSAQRRATNPAASDLRAKARADSRFQILQGNPQFQSLMTSP